MPDHHLHGSSAFSSRPFLLLVTPSSSKRAVFEDETGRFVSSSLNPGFFEDELAILRHSSSFLAYFEAESVAVKGNISSTIRGCRPVVRDICPFDA